MLVFSLIMLAGFGALIVHATHDTNGAYATMDYGDFVIGGSGAMTVAAPYAAGVSPANVNTNRYTLDTGTKQLHWQLDLTGLQIAGTRTNAFIAIQIPEGKQSNVTVYSPCLASDNGGFWEPCYVIATEWSNTLLVRRVSEANWSASNNTRLDINLTLEIRNTP
jgi:hypothetical protein